MIKIIPVKAFSDNNIWLLADESLKYCAVIDPGDEAPVLDFLDSNNFNLAAIFLTHHHFDHTNGVEGLISDRAVPVYGPMNETINSVTNKLKEGEEIFLDKMAITVKAMATPGHTKGHMVYSIMDSGSKYLFTGDTLFAGGCGRVFEGSCDEMYDSLHRISALADDTIIYPGHDYLMNNLTFISAIESENLEIKNFIKEEKEKRRKGGFSLSTTLKNEKFYNPFLRCHTASIRKIAEKRCGKIINNDAGVFTIIREWKNEF